MLIKGVYKMAIKITDTITTYSCPSCKAIVRTHNDGWFMIYVLLFIPVGLIALIIKAIAKKRKQYTAGGGEIITCPKCSKKIVLFSGIGGMTRLLILQKDMMNIIMPELKIIGNHQIDCNKYRNVDDEFSESLSLQFINTLNKKSCDVILIYTTTTIMFYINGQVFNCYEKKFSATIINLLK